MKTKFLVLPERKKPKTDVYMFDLCVCGHIQSDHESKVEKVNQTEKYGGLSDWQTIYHNCRKCVCQKFKFAVKMSSDDYYGFSRRLFLRTQKLEKQIESIERQLELVPIVVPEFFDSIEPKKDTMNQQSTLAKTTSWLKEKFAL